METPREPSVAPAWARWVLVAITAVAAWLRLPGLTAEEPWFDEVFSIVVASQDLPELWRRAVADQTNPPGFYLLLWGWTRLGGFDLAWMRLLPMLAATFTVPAMALAGRATGLGWTGSIAAAGLAATSPLLLAMSSEIRAYALVALATALTVSAAGHRRPVLTALGGAALVSLHYFGAFVVVAVVVGTIHEFRPRAVLRAVLPALPALVLMFAWLLIVTESADLRSVASNARWIDAFTWSDLPSFASQVVGTFGTTAGAWVVSLALLASLAVAIRHRLQLSASVAALPLLLAIIAAAISGRELWVARYLIITLPGWWLLLAQAMDRLPTRPREYAFAAIFSLLPLAGLRAEELRPKKTAWSNVARALTAGGSRVICSNESFVALPLRYQALAHGIPLTVLDLHECTALRGPDAIIMRKGTESSLVSLTRDGGALAGPPRELGTRLPETVLARLSWSVAAERK